MFAYSSETERTARAKQKLSTLEPLSNLNVAPSEIEVEIERL